MVTSLLDCGGGGVEAELSSQPREAEYRGDHRQNHRHCQRDLRAAFPCARKNTATPAAPMVCPSRRTVLSMPPAAPLRARGTEYNIARLFGAWKKPKPRPQNAMRHIRFNAVPSSGNVASSARPAGHHDEPNTAENRRRVAIGKSPGKRARHTRSPRATAS